MMKEILKGLRGPGMKGITGGITGNKRKNSFSPKSGGVVVQDKANRNITICGDKELKILYQLVQLLELSARNVHVLRDKEK